MDCNNMITCTQKEKDSPKAILIIAYNYSDSRITRL